MLRKVLKNIVQVVGEDVIPAFEVVVKGAGRHACLLGDGMDCRCFRPVVDEEVDGSIDQVSSRRDAEGSGMLELEGMGDLSVILVRYTNLALKGRLPISEKRFSHHYL